MRCPDCNRFVSYEEQEPEIDLELTADKETANITGTVRIVNACAECGTELKEANFDIDEQFEIPKEHQDHELSMEDASGDRDVRTEGSGRGMKTFYGATVSAAVYCGCAPNTILHQYDWSDYVAASEMDELV